jgi:LAO/AO transport system kinase
MLQKSGQLHNRRAAQALDWMWSEVNESLLTALREDPEVCRVIPVLEASVSEGRLPPVEAAEQLLGIFLNQHSNPD